MTQHYVFGLSVGRYRITAGDRTWEQEADSLCNWWVLDPPKAGNPAWEFQCSGTLIFRGSMPVHIEPIE